MIVVPHFILKIPKFCEFWFRQKGCNSRSLGKMAKIGLNFSRKRTEAEFSILKFNGKKHYKKLLE